MFLLDGTVVYSSSDLARAASCEFATVRALEATLGLIDKPDGIDDDSILDRTARLGGAHEDRYLREFRDRFGDGVAIIERPAHSRAGYDRAARATVEAVRSGRDVIYQGAVFDGRFLGFCDFLVRDGDACAVYDTKLSRHAKVTALLQLAAYADGLRRAGVT